MWVMRQLSSAGPNRDEMVHLLVRAFGAGEGVNLTRDGVQLVIGPRLSEEPHPRVF